MIALKKERDTETQIILAEFKAGIRTLHHVGIMDTFIDTLTFAKTAALIGEDETARKYFVDAKELLENGLTANSFHRLDRHKLIAALYDAGFEAEAQKELDDYIMIPLHEKRFPYAVIGDLLSNLAESGRFTEIVTIVKTIPDEEERFKLYDFIIFLVCLRYGEEDRVQMVVRKHFTSPQELLGIAEMLTDEPGGKSLESHRAKIRKYADKL